MAAPSGKADPRGAAERIERGIELYGAGNLQAALVELDEALKLHPGNARAKSYQAWIRGLLAGEHTLDGKKDGLDEDAVRAVAEALDEQSSPGMPPAGIRNLALPVIAADIADDHEQAPTIERRDVPPGLVREPNAPTTMHSHEHGDSPWDPVPLTPSGNERHPDLVAKKQGSVTRPQPKVAPQSKTPSGATLLGMPKLEPQLLAPDRKRPRVAEDRPESVTREFRSQTPTGPNLRPLDVPELTDEQIAGLLALDSPLIPESRTTPELRLERIDQLEHPDARLIELDAAHETQDEAPPRRRANDTTPTPIDAIQTGEFDSQSLTPTGVKAGAIRPVAPSSVEDDAYADLNLLPLEVAPDLVETDEAEEGGTNPTNPFIRGPKMAQYTSYGSGTDPKLDELPQLPTTLRPRPPATEPGMTLPRVLEGGPLVRAESALATGDAGAALDASELALQQAGAGADELVNVNRALLERIYAGVLGSPERRLVHGPATPDLDPRLAFLLSRIDGAMTVEDVLDVSGMSRTEAMRLLALLARRGAVKLR